MRRRNAKRWSLAIATTRYSRSGACACGRMNASLPLSRPAQDMETSMFGSSSPRTRIASQAVHLLPGQKSCSKAWLGLAGCATRRAASTAASTCPGASRARSRNAWPDWVSSTPCGLRTSSRAPTSLRERGFVGPATVVPCADAAAPPRRGIPCSATAMKIVQMAQLHYLAHRPDARLPKSFSGPQ
jgi:hypothetical protein